MAKIQSKEKAIEILRDKIITAITLQPNPEYRLQYVPDKAKRRSYGYLSFNIETKELKKDEYEYDNEHQIIQYFTAEEFHDYAIKYNLNEELQFFETEEDWGKLADELMIVYNSLRKKEKERVRLLHGAVIPRSMEKKNPEMNLQVVHLHLCQANGTSIVQLIRTRGCYTLDCYYGQDYRRDLTSTECVWVEQQVEAVINSSDGPGWASRMGFDSLSVIIRRDGMEDVEGHGGMPLKKYIELHGALLDLTMYGSRFEDEAYQKS